MVGSAALVKHQALANALGQRAVSLPHSQVKGLLCRGDGLVIVADPRQSGSQDVQHQRVTMPGERCGPAG